MYADSMSERDGDRPYYLLRVCAMKQGCVLPSEWLRACGQQPCCDGDQDPMHAVLQSVRTPSIRMHAYRTFATDRQLGDQQRARLHTCLHADE